MNIDIQKAEHFKDELEKDSIETAKILGITKKQALALVFIAKSAFCDMVKNQKGKALFSIAASHAAGKMSLKDMRKTMKLLSEI